LGEEGNNVPLDAEGNWHEPHSERESVFSPESIKRSMGEALHRGVRGVVLNSPEQRRLAEWYWANGYSIAKVEQVSKRVRHTYPVFARSLEGTVRPYYVSSRTSPLRPEGAARLGVFSANGHLLREWSGREAIVRVQEVERHDRTIQNVVEEALGDTQSKRLHHGRETGSDGSYAPLREE
jgi:hypothetical protein